MKDLSLVTLDNIRERHQDLSKYILRTPLVEVDRGRLTDHLDCKSLHLKLECFQHTGTFKARGALNVALQIPAEDKPHGITAVSAGNHAIAASWAARKLNMSAKVVMQSTANPYRVAMARAQQAEIVMKEPGPASFAEVDRLVEKEGRTFIHPFEGPHTTLGAAGAGLEIMEQLADVEAVIVSVGGGGLISGIASAVKLTNPNCKVYGVEPIGAASMSKSRIAGEPITLDKLDTLADSLAPPMALPFGFAVCEQYVDDYVTISDDQICAGVTLLQEDCKLAAEPAAGAALAGAIGPLREKLSGKKVCVLICGANIDATTYAQILLRGEKAIPQLI